MSIGKEERKELINRELDTYEEINSKATYKVKFRGHDEYLKVIRVNPNALLLNPKNNRLSSQLEDYSEKNTVLTDPTSVSSQKTLHKLLSETEQYSELKEQLKILGQQEPGLITRDGLLVNGNTRVAALRDLNIDYVDVAVLPSNVVDDDILSLEMSLQVQDLVHQDYTFTNELLLMKKFLDKGGNQKDLATKMGWIRRGESKVNTRMRLLNYIEEVRRLSSPPIPYEVFDSKEQHLKDLDTEYQRYKNEGDISAAEQLKWSRLTGIFLKLNKDQVRAIDYDFVSIDLNERLKNTDADAHQILEKYQKAPTNNGFSDLMSVNEEEELGYDMQSFLKDFLATYDEEDENFSKIATEARRVADRIIDEQKAETLKIGPITVLEETREKIAKLRADLPELVNSDGFKKGKLEFNLKKLNDEIKKLRTFIEQN